MFAFARAVLNHMLTHWNPPPPEEPDTAVRVPRWQHPGGRSSAIAVQEPDPPQRVEAIGSADWKGR